MVVFEDKKIRGIPVESGTVPENLPPEEDIKKLDKRLKKDEKRIADAFRQEKKLKQKGGL